MADFEFEVVPNKLRDSITPVGRSGVRMEHPIVDKLINDETIFVKGASDKELNGFYEVFRKRGYNLHKTKTTVNDEIGFLLYATKKEAE